VAAAANASDVPAPLVDEERQLVLRGVLLDVAEDLGVREVRERGVDLRRAVSADDGVRLGLAVHERPPNGLG
jgi:hypothetical protein